MNYKKMEFWPVLVLFFRDNLGSLEWHEQETFDYDVVLDFIHYLYQYVPVPVYLKFIIYRFISY
jgi:hypothetical protein